MKRSVVGRRVCICVEDGYLTTFYIKEKITAGEELVGLFGVFSFLMLL